MLQTGSGPVLLLGCAHAGIVEIMEDVSAKTGIKEFHGVIGGTHLGSAPDDYIAKAMDTLKKFKVKVIATSHCTGFHAACTVRTSFPGEFRTASVGDFFDF